MLAPVLPYELTFRNVPHEYIVNGQPLPSVTQILDAAGLADDGKAYYRPEHAIRGTAVHLASELYDLDDLGEIDPMLSGYLEAWIKFRELTGFQPVAIELRLASLTHGFCGTLDRIGWLDGQMALVDIKSGPYQRWHDLQLGGYCQLVMDNLAALELEQPPVKFAIVELHNDGTYALPKLKTPITQARGVFLGAHNLLKWKGNR